MNLLPMGDLIRFHAERKPEDAIALSFPDGEVTWWELERRANQRARFYRERGVVKDDIVTISAPNSWRLFEHTFGLWKLGATPNVISPRLAPQEVKSIIEFARPKLVIADGAPLGGRDTVPIDAELVGQDDAPLMSDVASHWKIMTSGGSNGRPKLIVDMSPSLFSPTETQLYLPNNGKVMAPGPLYHNSPFASLHSGLFAGSHCVGMARFDPEECLRLVGRHRIEWLMLVPTMMHRIWQLPDEIRDSFDLSSLRHVWHSAAAISRDLKQAWIDWLGPERIFEIYGGTEGAGVTVISGDEWLNKRGSVGRAAGHAGLKILREDGSECAAGEIGEIFFVPHDSARQAYAYIGGASRRRADGADSFGDLGYLDEDGYLFLADRRTDMIIRGGANIFPAEVEMALDSFPDIQSSLVIGLPDEEMGSRVHALIQPRPGAEISFTVLSDHLRERLAPYKLPESYEIAQQPLRDDAGKARRSALSEERAAWARDGKAFKAWARQSS